MWFCKRFMMALEPPKLVGHKEFEDFFLELSGGVSQTFSFLQQKLIGDMKDICLFFMYYCMLFSYGKKGVPYFKPFILVCQIHLGHDGSEVKVENDEILDIFNFLVALALASGAFAVGSCKLCHSCSFGKWDLESCKLDVKKKGQLLASSQSFQTALFLNDYHKPFKKHQKNTAFQKGIPFQKKMCWLCSDFPIFFWLIKICFTNLRILRRWENC